MLEQSEKVAERLDLQSVGKTVTNWLQERIHESDPQVREAVDVLHGKGLGHPLHPLLTDITIGAWTLGGFLGVLGTVARLPGVRRASGLLHTVGTLSALPTALSGLADYSGIKQDALEMGTLHAATNGVALLFHLLAWRSRWRDKPLKGFILALLGTGVATVGAWVGGDLVYRLRVGVNHSTGKAAKDDWAPALADGDLPNYEPVRVEVDGTPVLLYRDDRRVYAINAVCAHAGGPLEDGTVEGVCVTCPWHGSTFDLRNGGIVHGPTAYPQAAYETRIRDGQIEIRAAHEYTRMV